MINLMQFATDYGCVQVVPFDPGVRWRSEAVAVDAPPDHDTEPVADATWPAGDRRSGICGVVSPRAITLPDGRYRLYYTQILPRPGFPSGANDYDNATSRILSAISQDGTSWTPEPGVRLTPQDAGAGDFRVASSDVVPMLERPGWFRMFFECCPGSQTVQNSIRSAISSDGLTWQVESGVRLEVAGGNLSSPRLVLLEGGRSRLYCALRGTGIISAIDAAGSNSFEMEPGVRLEPRDAVNGTIVFAPEIIRLPDSSYRMYFAEYRGDSRAAIMTTCSQDGLEWDAEPQQVLGPGNESWNAAKCSEMCLLHMTHNATGSCEFRMLYEACDGTAESQRGVWRIASATCVP